VGAGGIGQALQLFEVFVDMDRIVRTLARSPDQECTFYW
jgi:hypothetical protein